MYERNFYNADLSEYMVSVRFECRYTVHNWSYYESLRLVLLVYFNIVSVVNGFSFAKGIKLVSDSLNV